MRARLDVAKLLLVREELMLVVNKIVKHFGPEPVLDGVSFDLRKNERAALVGPNGAGKSTLMNIICGLQDADSGTVEIPGDLRLGYLEQHARFGDDATVWSVASEALADLSALARQAEETAERLATAADQAQRERLGELFDRLQHELQRRDGYHLDHKIHRVLSGLGFSEETHAQAARTLSGGQQNRLLLARLLLSDPDILLLDEPSNHLDIAATQWLESYLLDTSSALLVVSHDRYFLDRVATRTLELCHATVDSYAGNYSAYRRQRAERLEVQRRTFEKQQAEIAKLEDFVRRNHHGQKHAQAEDRRRKLERIERVTPPREIPAPPMGFPSADRTGDIVLRCRQLAKGFEPGRPLFENLTFDILRGEKWGILGPNGAGKTTLLRCLLGQLAPDAGDVVQGAGVRIGYFDQALHCLADDATAVDAIRPGHKDFVEQQRRDMLARFGIIGDMAFQPVRSLSGGERNRTALAMLGASDANFLILDEPTNHLDLWSRASLEASIQKFNGTVLFVSHDRYFLNQVADHLLVVEPDRFRVIEGNYDTFVHFVERGLAAEATVVGAAAKPAGGGASGSGGGKKGKRVRAREPQPKRKFPVRKAADIEHDITHCESRIAELHQRLADPQVLRDGEAVKQAKEQLDAEEQQLALLYEHWEEVESRD